MTCVPQIDEAIQIFKNYKPQYLMCAVPDIWRYIGDFEENRHGYSPKCKFCQYLLVCCDECLFKPSPQSLLTKFRSYCKSKNKNIKLIDDWLKDLGWSFLVVCLKANILHG